MSAKKNIPPAPIRPASSFFLWRKENYDRLAKEFGTLKTQRLNKKMAKCWRELDEEEKGKYSKQADKLMEKYQKDHEAYVSTYGEKEYEKSERTKVQSKKKSKSKPKTSISKARSAKGCK